MEKSFSANLDSIPLEGQDFGQLSEQAQLKKQQEDAMEEQRQAILGQILESEAKERLARIAIVKQEKARAVEQMLIQAATTGKLQGKVSEEQLIGMLEQVNEQETKKQTKVTINRRKYFDDEDDDDNDDDLM
mmetsp:Transcript_29212/g.38425  ORF Transcript_29212/g.38425 Transcript_29212/m.38425 type:complete len:132 (+) Transcript_29212:79-474(+)|eukprot:CAMPEP_0117755414 /NCGR_PEP_ID=MMETSP0947-20121206/13438_1 /TAXON_ID=44440 /ORGANISM="Chattonella subsalsa, Strain CCMP2191" /LENGTH=131 /DNA_ID=CAMNT_0005574745 /DNA_START=280 /DNA_END=675 /DNA_ORIENTATION=+